MRKSAIPSKFLLALLATFLFCDLAHAQTAPDLSGRTALGLQSPAGSAGGLPPDLTGKIPVRMQPRSKGPGSKSAPDLTGKIPAIAQPVVNSSGMVRLPPPLPSSAAQKANQSSDLPTILGIATTLGVLMVGLLTFRDKRKK